MPKLTKTLVESLPKPEKETFVWDTEIKGFGVKVFPTGAKTFVFQYRAPEGQTRRLTIGKLSDALTVDQARQIAKAKLREVLNGGDPQGEKQARRLAPTLGAVFDAYLASGVFAMKTPATKAADRGRIERHLRPLLGRLIAEKLTTDDVIRARRAIAEGKTATDVKTGYRGRAIVTGGEGTARKAVVLLRAICRWSTREGMPAGTAVAWDRVNIGRDGIRETIIEDADTYRRLFDTLQTLEDQKRIRPAAADAIRFIALTGARKGEAVGLRWRYVDLRTGRVVFPARAHKAGHLTGRPRIIALPAAAQAILARQPQGGADDLVFQPAKGDGVINLNKVWVKVRTEAGLSPELGLHGLRHSVATHLAMSGASAVELMEVLGHRQMQTTLRYLHFAERARSTLAERAAAVAMAGLEGRDKAEVVTIKRGRR